MSATFQKWGGMYSMSAPLRRNDQIGFIYWVDLYFRNEVQCIPPPIVIY